MLEAPHGPNEHVDEVAGVGEEHMGMTASHGLCEVPPAGVVSWTGFCDFANGALLELVDAHGPRDGCL